MAMFHHLIAFFRRNKAKADVSPWKKAYQESDYGRKFGWWVLIDGIRVAELAYLAWDRDSQFWHTYELTVLDPRGESLTSSEERWDDHRVALQNKYVSDSVITDFLVSIHADNVVGLRSACVDEASFQTAYRVLPCDSTP